MTLLQIDAATLEYAWIRTRPEAPVLVMLHEGLGSVALWKDFPMQVAQVTGHAVLVYSREGHGRSSPLQSKRPVSYMHREALEILPRLLDALQIERPVLFGHSDGASIALIHAGGSGREVAGVIAMAPHVMVEDISITSIAAARQAYESTDLPARLGRYHDDVDGVFRGWNDIWLDPAFRNWNIEEFLPRIECPILAIQGEQDEYGTMDQLTRIARAAPRVELLKLDDCQHSPHRSHPDRVLEAVGPFVNPRRG